MPRPTHEEVERGFRAAMEEGGLPAPDEVAHWQDCVAFYWHATKSIVVIDLDEIDPTFEHFDPALAFAGDDVMTEEAGFDCGPFGLGPFDDTLFLDTA